MPDLETSLAYCSFCPNLCHHACPVSNAEATETLVPRAKMIALDRLRGRRIEPTVENTAALHACTGCGACTEACLHKVAPGEALFAGRAALVREGHGHPALDGLPARVRANAERAAAAMREGLPVARFPSEAQVALLPGCDDPRAAATALALFGRVGADYVAVADVTLACGGYPLLAGGHVDAFRLHADTVARQLQGYARVVVACPACATTMRTEYPARGIALRPEVLHLAEFLASFADKLPVARRLPAARYHDPCYLGRRGGGVYEAPRKLLARALVEVREFSRRRGEAECSGGGGALPLTMPEAADAIAEARLVEVREAGESTVVTACPTCKRRLSRDGVQARDLLDVLEEATRPIS
jgi:Fe-S oxidoreductase